MQGMAFGGPVNFPGMLETEFRLTASGTSFNIIDQEIRQQRQAEAQKMMMAIVLGAAVNVNRLPVIREPYQIRVGNAVPPLRSGPRGTENRLPPTILR